MLSRKYFRKHCPETRSRTQFISSMQAKSINRATSTRYLLLNWHSPSESHSSNRTIWNCACYSTICNVINALSRAYFCSYHPVYSRNNIGDVIYYLQRANLLRDWTVKMEINPMNSFTLSIILSIHWDHSDRLQFNSQCDTKTVWTAVTDGFGRLLNWNTDIFHHLHQ